VMTAVLAVGNLAVCAGWAATAEERMACCAQDDQCAMHRATHGEKVVTQAEADTCCAASEKDHSARSAQLLVLTVPPVKIDYATVDALLATHAAAPRRIADHHVSKRARHLLLSVLLV
jgi:hypothetical protein